MTTPANVIPLRDSIRSLRARLGQPDDDREITLDLAELSLSNVLLRATAAEEVSDDLATHILREWRLGVGRGER